MWDIGIWISGIIFGVGLMILFGNLYFRKAIPTPYNHFDYPVSKRLHPISYITTDYPLTELVEPMKDQRILVTHKGKAVACIVTLEDLCRLEHSLAHHSLAECAIWSNEDQLSS